MQGMLARPERERERDWERGRERERFRSRWYQMMLAS